jgi:hypothetical protein
VFVLCYIQAIANGETSPEETVHSNDVSEMRHMMVRYVATHFQESPDARPDQVVAHQETLGQQTDGDGNSAEMERMWQAISQRIRRE